MERNLNFFFFKFLTRWCRCFRKDRRMKIPSHEKKKEFLGVFFYNFFFQWRRLLVAPADPGVPFSPFRLAVRDCGTFRRYCGQTEREGQKQHAPRPPAARKVGRAKERRSQAIFLDFRIFPHQHFRQVCALLEKKIKKKTVRVCVWEGRELLPAPGSCAHEIRRRRPWKDHALCIVRDWTRSPARTLKPTGGWEDRLRKSFKYPLPPKTPVHLLSIRHARSRHIRRFPRWKK